jgi:two-component system sensor histidine kinase KdpD
MGAHHRRLALNAGTLAAAVVAPVLLTLLVRLAGGSQSRDYVFLYMGLVAVLALVGRLWPSLVAAAVSFLLVDFNFVRPFYTLTIADPEDVVNLLVFFGTAGLVSVLASRQHRARLAAEELMRQLRDANADLVRLNREQAESAQAEIRLARTEQQVAILRENDRYRRELLANVSHDLRTPIATILTSSTDMLSGGEHLERGLRVIASEARRLNALVGDLLDMSRIESGALELDIEPVRLVDAIEAAAARLRERSPGRQVTWEGSGEDLEVMADWTRLGEVLDNLLANADRFAPPGTPVEIHADTEEPEYASVRIVDRGPGVAPEIRGRLFDRFVKSGPEDGTGGTGLGLAIVRGLIEAQAGRVELEPDAPGRGASFRFTLPLAIPPEAAG